MRTKIKYYFFIFLLVVASCENREWDNPFDPNCPKEIFTPTSFTATQEGEQVILSWNQTNPNITGFKIERQVESESFSAIASPGKNEISVTNDISAGGKLHTYKLYALAGSNKSNEATTSITPVLQAAVTTKAVTEINATSAVSGGTVTDDGGSPVTARGMVWNTTGNPTLENNSGKTTDGSGKGSFTSELTGLDEGTEYYVSAYATNSIGTVYGNEVKFETNQSVSLASVTTSSPAYITSSSAILGGNVLSDGNDPVTEKGICYSTGPVPTTSSNKLAIGAGIGNFSNTISGLTSYTTYFFRAYAINSQGTAYGEIISFITQIAPIQFNPNLSYGTMTDVEGNVYRTIVIGTQTWMAENLKTTKYRDGEVIPNVIVDATWAALTTGAYCWYKNDATTFKNTIGALYNWYSVNTGKLCPTGWHIPSDTEWTTLTTFLGGGSVAGGKMKETGTVHWLTPNTGATNSSGFTGLPDGGRNRYGNFMSFGAFQRLRSSTEYDATRTWYIFLINNDDNAVRNLDYKNEGYSVRCLKD